MPLVVSGTPVCRSEGASQVSLLWLFPAPTSMRTRCRGTYLPFVTLPSAITVPWPTVFRRLGLVCVQRRRHLHFGIPYFLCLPSTSLSKSFTKVSLFPTIEPPV